MVMKIDLMVMKRYFNGEGNEFNGNEYNFHGDEKIF